MLRFGSVVLGVDDLARARAFWQAAELRERALHLGIN